MSAVGSARYQNLLAVPIAAVLLLAAAPARGDLLISGLHIAPVGRPPLSDAAAARRVHRSSWEPRPENYAANHRVPSRAQLARFHAQSQNNPYQKYVDGRYRGTTDEILQWAADKWGLDPNLLRAVAALETWWYMRSIGNGGTAFGLFQVRKPWHCSSTTVCAAFRQDTAFNADYYASIVRSYFDGKQTWLYTISGNGARYRPGDLWGSVGAWASGRWHDPNSLHYAALAKDDLRLRPWQQPYFVGK